MELSFSTNLLLAGNGQRLVPLLRPSALPQHLSCPVPKKHNCNFHLRVNVSATPAEIDKKDETLIEDKRQKQELLACPVCFQPLIRKGPSGINSSAISRSAFKCGCCKKAFSSRDVYLDLTLASAIKEYEEVLPTGTELFRSPFVSFVYERGWRQSFARSGFPGPDEEVKLAKEFLKPTIGGTLLDVSCGSGLFSRRFAKPNDYASVIASDFSENMLRQCYQFIKQDPELENANIALVRADVARLPFATRTIDAVHAGAALHCWPSPLAGDLSLMFQEMVFTLVGCRN